MAHYPQGTYRAGDHNRKSGQSGDASFGQ